MLFKEDLISMLEVVLFVSVEPLTKEKLSEILRLNEEELESVIKEYEEILTLPGRGLELLQAAGGYKLVTKGAYFDIVEKVVKPQGGQLSKAALETLAIVAYKQPVTRSEIEEIRGVNVDTMVHKLLEKDLIIEVGRKDVPGHPNLYGTTDNFLILLGLNSLDDLPDISAENEIIAEDELFLNNKSLEMEIVSKEKEDND